MGRRERRKQFNCKEFTEDIVGREFARMSIFFENIAATIFKWTGALPKTCRSAWIERQLFNRGQLCYFQADWKKDTYDGSFILPLANAGQINAYSELIQYDCISPQKTFKRTIDNAVLIRNNELRMSTFEMIEPLIFELADIRAAMFINRNNACKTPAIFHVSDKKQMTALNAYEQITGNKAIILMNDLGADLRSDYSFGNERAPYYGKELREEYDRILAEILTIMGIISNPVVKAERVTTIEAASNRGLIVDSIDSRLQCRQEACDAIREMFGVEITVEVNNAYTFDMIKQGLGGMDGNDESDDKGGENNAT